MWLEGERTALYRLYDSDGILLYVGIGVRPVERWKAHERQKAWWPEVTGHTLEWFDDRPAALAAELAAMQTERPRHNVTGSPWAPGPRALSPNEVTVGRLRAAFPKVVERAVTEGQFTYVVDLTKARKRVAVLVPVEWYERAKAALGEC